MKKIKWVLCFILGAFTAVSFGAQCTKADLIQVIARQLHVDASSVTEQSSFVDNLGADFINTGCIYNIMNLNKTLPLTINRICDSSLECADFDTPRTVGDVFAKLGLQ